MASCEKNGKPINVVVAIHYYINSHCIHKQESEICLMKTTVAKKFEPKHGPFFQCLSRSLVELNIDRQAYHGGTFVGNHVNKLLKVLCNIKITHKH